MKMRLIFFCVALLGCPIGMGGLLAQEKALPRGAQALVEKLDIWEKEQRQKLEQEIQAKRTEVARLLEKEMAEATKRGDLDGALALRAKIAALMPASNSSPSGGKSAEEELADKVCQGRWGWLPADPEHRLTFRKGGRGEMATPSGVSSLAWSIEEGKFTFTMEGREGRHWTLTPGADGKTCLIESHAGDKRLQEFTAKHHER